MFCTILIFPAIHKFIHSPLQIPKCEKERERGREREISLEELSNSNGQGGAPFWVSYRGGVYDLTEYQEQHPGGKFMQQAAGADIEQFWSKWALHFESNEAQAVLKRSRIGGLVKTETETEDDVLENENEAYLEEPLRDTSKHTVFSTTPFNRYVVCLEL